MTVAGGLKAEAELEDGAQGDHHQQGDERLYKGGHLIFGEIGRIRPHARLRGGGGVADALLAVSAHQPELHIQQHNHHLHHTHHHTDGGA